MGLSLMDKSSLVQMDKRVSRRGGKTDASPRISAVFFSSYKLSKTVRVTALLLSGHVTLLCGTFLCITTYWYLKNVLIHNPCLIINKDVMISV